jgi:uracil-DNA glycosylase
MSLTTVHLPQPTFETWRDAARSLLARGIGPDEVLWSEEPSLFSTEEAPVAPAAMALRVSKAFVDLARSVTAHRSPQRHALLYRVLWRLSHGESRLLANPADADLRQLELWRKAVSRDIHKTHAFVRFRQTGSCPETGREQFVAWFEPEHRSLPLSAPFFQKRFTSMDWAILTPDCCASWDGVALEFSPGIPRSQAPATEDALEGLWRSYYQSIFNPARLKVKMMKQEMPMKYWKNLPEAELIAELTRSSGQRTHTMLETELRPAKPAPDNAYLKELHRRNAAEG